MKKVISVFLAALMIFSAFGMTLAYAAEEEKETYTVKFVYVETVVDGDEIKNVEKTVEFTVEAGVSIEAPEYPATYSEGKTTYIFKGWKAEGSDELYHKNTIPAVTGDVTYTAVYSEQTEKETMSFFALIRSIFSSFNIIIEYFFRVFGKKD